MPAAINSKIIKNTKIISGMPSRAILRALPKPIPSIKTNMHHNAGMVKLLIKEPMTQNNTHPIYKPITALKMLDKLVFSTSIP